MNLRKILGILLLAAGTLALIYRGFNYTSDKHTAHLGSLDFTVKEKKRLDLPVWAGVVVNGSNLIPARFLTNPLRVSSSMRVSQSEADGDSLLQVSPWSVPAPAWVGSGS